ncbi:bifunctional diaminohydroxyphosphoribosylaminopyrimidine deaminase/5-amino-6-(5-phosphoribosylamino)uracil reductase RibD [Oligella urethralis]|uniref:bifunctional diaminohydroxyphosphoribosylaminopyrimidine deaminase/5-amino-6-(5-phosphoribosylamino)uracil reductase RibD n=1 Tax=Oligella urethralis TaxID=90245 RepID=UPI00254EA7AE|nr:bifunctional diaminohydroxyphosphoribosylaminopyrimidine deaminase/5-amino-6-(5-phosphoribosylamino)uracil reductase RibD [Oligella urethralis]MDK6203486.1 bifunctional diaminohydroxyphosphoribosylaminopyrimidine deaminase/5-amino-6-(5-phosphoribosylamino)uracil reductase RibD [Oligella urethralis]
MNPSPEALLRQQDEQWMREAIQLAHSALYITSPNPRVACLIVRDGRVVGKGSTQAAGQDHAEVQAIKDAKARVPAEALRVATFYVTLEPCSHYGRTPPCVDAVIACQPARVVIAMRDPNPLVAGRSITKMQQAGIEVCSGILAEEALALNPGFISRMVTKRPWLRSKIACSMDAKVALADGESKWITATAARADGQHWRARSCVVLTGIGTVLADDPLLNVRAVETSRQPIRAVIDRRFIINEKAALFNGDPVWLFMEDRALTAAEQQKEARLVQEKNARLIKLPLSNSHGAGEALDLHAVMAYLADNEMNEVHLEAGPRLNAAFLEANLMDEVLMYMAPKIIGPGREAFALSPLQRLSEARQMVFFEQQLVGTDIRLSARDAQRWQAMLAAISE